MKVSEAADLSGSLTASCSADSQLIPAVAPPDPDSATTDDCHYCRKMLAVSSTTIDHIVPRALYGVNAKWNYVLSCEPCNRAKGAKFPTCECERCVYAIKQNEAIRNKKFECHYCKLMFYREMVFENRIVHRGLGGRNGKYNYALACEHCLNARAGKAPTCTCDRCTYAIAESVRLLHLRQQAVSL